MAGLNDNNTSGGTNEDVGNAMDDAAELNKFSGEVYEDGKKVSEQESKTGKEAPQKFQTPSQKAAAAAAAGGTKTTDEGEEDEDGEVKPNTSKDPTIQKRINIAVGKQRQAERERDAANAKFTAMEARLAALEKTPAQKATEAKVKDPNKAPVADDYDYGEADIEFIKDTVRYETRKELGAVKETETKVAQTAAQKANEAAAQAELNKFFAAGKEKFGDDYEEKVTSEDMKITPQLAKLLLDSKNGIDIAFDLTADPKLAAKVSALAGDPVKQAAWFGSYEDKYYPSDTADADEDEDEGTKPEVKTPTSKPISRAPKPPEHKNRGGGSSEAATASTSDFAAFERMATAKR